ncbi:hypothetical protein M514_07293 [Trichuris suis]|uniref:Uncharacterized protein n=1 Tax=Trichuris suis TaxID=68888 RepID=A0A085M3H0_9BILA|nr:hypothetical protein M513_07293 [Trichuris suis]KFD64203.1 hypothetical protein M514_07293 [Trichuris suis]
MLDQNGPLTVTRPADLKAPYANRYAIALTRGTRSHAVDMRATAGRAPEGWFAFTSEAHKRAYLEVPFLVAAETLLSKRYAVVKECNAFT